MLHRFLKCLYFIFSMSFGNTKLFWGIYNAHVDYLHIFHSMTAVLGFLGISCFLPLTYVRQHLVTHQKLLLPFCRCWFLRWNISVFLWFSLAGKASNIVAGRTKFWRKEITAWPTKAVHLLVFFQNLRQLPILRPPFQIGGGSLPTRFIS